MAVIRYLPRRYVEAFFKTGKLRLASFEGFRGHQDHERGDLREGRGGIEVTTPDSRHAAVVTFGQEAYILCASLRRSDALAAQFGVDAAIEIVDLDAFSQVIAQAIEGCLVRTQGPCVYVDEPILRFHAQSWPHPPENEAAAESWSEEYERWLGAMAGPLAFRKSSQFEAQAEYRFVWYAGGRQRSSIQVEVRSALKFCKAVAFSPIRVSASS